MLWQLIHEILHDVLLHSLPLLANDRRHYFLGVPSDLVHSFTCVLVKNLERLIVARACHQIRDHSLSVHSSVRDQCRQFLGHLLLALQKNALHIDPPATDVVGKHRRKNHLDGNPVCAIPNDQPRQRQRYPRAPGAILGDLVESHLKKTQDQSHLSSAAHNELKLLPANLLEHVNQQSGLSQHALNCHLFDIQNRQHILPELLPDGFEARLGRLHCLSQELILHVSWEHSPDRRKILHCEALVNIGLALG
mmetsp:Transcript_33266/g.70339  ORF Transcript_33266/g.70339 Transcript_33266/m.70339 type:complete len:250 (+) Transcript_33266:559-1308(+)